MKGWSSSEIISVLRKDGWKFEASVGSHHQFVHQSKPGKVTVPHPQKDLSTKTVNSIFRQAGIRIDGK
jgi:predicted RNA binding protein YcfA (HicA-like mRNA interferase family)